MSFHTATSRTPSPFAMTPKRSTMPVPHGVPRSSFRLRRARRDHGHRIESILAPTPPPARCSSLNTLKRMIRSGPKKRTTKLARRMRVEGVTRLDPQKFLALPHHCPGFCITAYQLSEISSCSSASIYDSALACRRRISLKNLWGNTRIVARKEAIASYLS